MEKVFVILLFCFAVLGLIFGCIQPPVCGNGVCEISETPQNCPSNNGGDCSPNLMTCSALGGITCQGDEKCSSYTLPASDSAFCCIQGQCQPKQCTNECSTEGEKTCELNLLKSCGNYDTDDCLEWSSGTTCQYGCSNGECNPQQDDETFILIHNGSFSGKKFNLYFINYAYEEKGGINQFYEDIQNLVFLNSNQLKGFLYAEPFNTYKDRFNIYKITILLDGKVPNCNENNPCHPDEIIGYVSHTYSIPIELIDEDNTSPYANTFVLLVQGSEREVVVPGALAASIRSGIYINRDMSQVGGIEGGIIDFFHEFGHSFARIQDEYGLGYMQGGNHLDEYIDNVHDSNTNCDPVPGCPSWCSGEPKQIQRTDPCAKRLNPEDCHNQQFQDDGLYVCVWIENTPRITDYFGSRCIPALENYGDIGTTCVADLGCYFGCFGDGWRGTYNSIYAGFFDTNYQKYSQNGIYPYTKLQQKMIERYILNLN